MTRVRKAVITAAGRGTRQYPATNTVQKELFPLVDTDGYAKPTLQIIVEEVLAAGIEEVCIVANPTNLEPIKQHFRGMSEAQRTAQFAGKQWAIELSDRLDEIAQRLTFVVQSRQEGFGHAVYQAKDWASGEPFVLLLGDHVYLSELPERCTRQVVAAFETNDCSVSSVVRVPESLLFRYGTIAGVAIDVPGQAIYQIADMAEKPSIEYAQAHLRTPGLAMDEYLSFFGIHVFTPAIFDCLEELIRQDMRQKGEFQLTSAQELLWKRAPYLACEVQGKRFDMGIPEGFIETQIALALHSPFQQQARALLTGT